MGRAVRARLWAPLLPERNGCGAMAALPESRKRSTTGCRSQSNIAARCRRRVAHNLRPIRCPPSQRTSGASAITRRPSGISRLGATGQLNKQGHAQPRLTARSKHADSEILRASAISSSVPPSRAASSRPAREGGSQTAPIGRQKESLSEGT